MSFDEQEYSKDDHDMHDACEEIKRLRAALEEAATSITQIMILRGTMQTAAELESKRADESQARADRAEAKLTAAEARIIELQSMDTKDSQENAALKDEISTLEAVNAGTVYVQGTVDAMREERDKAEAEVVHLKAQLSAHRGIIDDYRRLLDLVGEADAEIMCGYLDALDGKEK